MKAKTMNLKNLFATTAVASALAVAAHAAPASCGYEGKLNNVLPTTLLSTSPITTPVNPKMDLAIRVKPGATGNTSFTLVLKSGTNEISKSTITVAPAADGLNVAYQAPLTFDSFVLTGVSVGSGPSATAVQAR